MSSSSVVGAGAVPALPATAAAGAPAAGPAGSVAAPHGPEGGKTLTVGEQTAVPEEGSRGQPTSGPDGCAPPSLQWDASRMLGEGHSPGTEGDGDGGPPFALVDAYIAKLEVHCRNCELTGRYQEASFAARRAHDLRIAQADMLRGQLAQAQTLEVELLEHQYQQECEAAEDDWRAHAERYDVAVAAQMAALKASQSAELALVMEAAEVGQSGRFRPSAAYQEQRRLEELLVKQGQYRAAHEAARGADLLQAADLAASLAARDATRDLRAARLAARNQGQIDALMQRARRGREELELRRVEGASRRAARFRAAARELSQAHSLEAAHLERAVATGQGASLWAEQQRQRQQQRLNDALATAQKLRAC